MVDIARFDAIHTAVYGQALADIQIIDIYCQDVVLDALNYNPGQSTSTAPDP
jgi:hypothetical protein